MTTNHIPTKITLTRKLGFSRDAAFLLRELAREQDQDPREFAAKLLTEALEQTISDMEVCNDAPRAD